MKYNLNPTGDNVVSVTLVLTGDTTGSDVFLGFNADPVASCGLGVFAAANTTYTCDNGGASFTRPTVGLTATAVVVN